MTEMNSVVHSSYLQQLIERLKPLHVILSQNTYVKDTTNRLKRLIDDASSQPIMLFLGKERVGKTTLINALIGRNLLEESKSEPTTVNTFIKYGEQECVKAVFLDGMVATFDLSKLKLLTLSPSEGAKIIREHLDYIEVYVKEDILKDFTVIDSVGLESGANDTAYFSQLLIQRVDEVFWVVRADTPATDDEINFIKKLATIGVRPNLIMNGIDLVEQELNAFIARETNAYGNYLQHVVAVSGKLALEARNSQNRQMLTDSRITELSQLIQQLTINQEKKTQHVVTRLIDWLERLRKEMELIPTREPYISAFENVERYQSDIELEFTRKQRDLALISAYEEEYETVSKVFKEVQTLYQLLQALASERYLRDGLVEKYEEIASIYQKNVRDYRKLHAEYTIDYNRLAKQYEKQTNKELTFPIPPEDMHGLLEDKIYALNKIQSQLVSKQALIDKYKEFVKKNLYVVQNRLNELAANRLRTIQGQVNDLTMQRKRERTYLHSYATKLTEFNCIIEAQSYIKEAIAPILLEGPYALSAHENDQLRHTIDFICAVDLTHQALYKRLHVTDFDELIAQIDFETKYKLVGLSLTEADILSDIPPIPAVIEQ